MWRCHLSAVSLSSRPGLPTRQLPRCWPSFFLFFLAPPPPSPPLTTPVVQLSRNLDAYHLHWQWHEGIPCFSPFCSRKGKKSDREQSWYGVIFRISEALFLWISLQERILDEPTFLKSGQIYEIQHPQSCSCNFAWRVDLGLWLTSPESSLTPGFCYKCDILNEFWTETFNRALKILIGHIPNDLLPAKVIGAVILIFYFYFFKILVLWRPLQDINRHFSLETHCGTSWSVFNCHEVTRSKPGTANSVGSPASFDGKIIGIHPPFQTGSKLLKSPAGSSTDLPAHLFLRPWLPGGRVSSRDGALRRKRICLRGDPAELGLPQSGPPWHLSDGGMSVAPRRMIDFLQNTKKIPKCIKVKLVCQNALDRYRHLANSIAGAKRSEIK